ncbi:MAG TPA: type II toxin-antitoxin system Phd/YefM family antitoxin [Steroidobacteraceae bacterium]|nr:type II toxin-antitoxin system Phd/YefM family antitoxin [Steroidobacteraceae bacterium]
MTKSVGVHEAKTNLSKLLERVSAGEEITITRRGEEVARLVPPRLGSARRLGIDRGRWVVPDDFDAPLSNEMVAAFER